MTNHEDQTLGEVGRSVDRIERMVSSLNDQLRAALGPLAALEVRLANVETDVIAITHKVDTVEIRSAAIAGGIGVIAFLLELVPSWIKGH